MLNYGFEGTVRALQTITAPDTIAEGAINIPVRFDILVCKEICIPESVEKNLTFNSPNTAQIKASVDMINDVQSSFPIGADVNGWTTQLSEKDEYMFLDIQTNIEEAKLKNSDIEFFSYEYGLIQYPAPTAIIIDENRIIFKQARGDFALDRIENIGGVLILTDQETGIRSSYQLAPQIVENIPAIAQSQSIAADNETSVNSLSVTEGLPPKDEISIGKALSICPDWRAYFKSDAVRVSCVVYESAEPVQNCGKK